MNPGIARRFAGLTALTALTGMQGAWAHHTYTMFDGSRTAQVTGTVARLEWRNPHVYVWVYVPDPKAAGGYMLYAFENGATNVLQRRGWSKNLLRAGDPITVRYWPLKDGRPGGHFEEATLADGRVMRGSGGPRGDGPVTP